MPPKEVSIGVLLDDDTKLREALAHADNIDYLVEPRDVDQMLDYLAKLARQGKRVRTLLLTGHGRKKVHKIGKLEPRDMDLTWTRRRREAAYGNRLDAEKQITRIDRELARAKDATARRHLKDERRDQADRLKDSGDEYRTMSRRETQLQDIEDVMAPEGMVGLLNCYADANPAGRRFMANIAQVLLRRNGGRLVGNTGLIITAKIQPVLAWITGQPDHLVFPVGDWTTLEESGTGTSGRRCGVPCKDFARYGLCDHPAGRDGGPCFQHR